FRWRISSPSLATKSTPAKKHGPRSSISEISRGWRGLMIGLLASTGEICGMSETKTLASYVVSSHLEDIPQDVCHEARRAIVNYVGCAVGGSLHPAVDIAIRALGPFSGPASAHILGRGERLDPLHASLMNGISSHVYDYDDTTPKNYSHPTSPVASALFAYASANLVRGSDFMEAFILGFEAESRVANAVYPAHYDVGWHITGTSGVFGAATAIGKLLGLSVQEMIWAIGLAATQAAGLREMF